MRGTRKLISPRKDAAATTVACRSCSSGAGVSGGAAKTDSMVKEVPAI